MKTIVREPLTEKCSELSTTSAPTLASDHGLVGSEWDHQSHGRSALGRPVSIDGRVRET